MNDLEKNNLKFSTSIFNWRYDKILDDIWMEKEFEKIHEYFMNKFPFMNLLQYIPQYRDFHAEKDVLTHTKMVCKKAHEWLEKENINDLEERKLIYISAFFHDWGKLKTTEIDLWGQDSSISYMESFNFCFNENKISDECKKILREAINLKKIKVIEVLIFIEDKRDLKEDEKKIIYPILELISKNIEGDLKDLIKEDFNGIFDLQGKITSPNHSLVGAQDARYILMNLKEDFDLREKIVQMIKNHQKPFFLLSQSENEIILKEQVNQLNQKIDLRYILPMALNDLRGRLIEDKNKKKLDLLISDVELIMMEKDLLLEKRESIFEKKNENKYILVLCGLPCVGKDTFIVNLKNQKNPSEYLSHELGVEINFKDLKVLSFDDSRKEFSKNANGFDLNNKLRGQSTQKVYQEAKELLARQDFFIWNATNIDKISRKKIIDLCKSYDVSPIILYMERPLIDILKDNHLRDKTISNEKIKEMALTMDIPLRHECKHVIYKIQKKKIMGKMKKP